MVTAADPAAALKAAAALVAGVGSADPTAQPKAAALLARITTPPAQAVSLRTLNPVAGLQPNASATAMDGDTLDELAALLAGSGSAQALLAAAALSRELADLLDVPPFNRTERCADALQSNVASEVGRRAAGSCPNQPGPPPHAHPCPPCPTHHMHTCMDAHPS